MVAALPRLWECGGIPAGEDEPEQSLGSARMQYRGVAAPSVARRRDRAAVSGSGLVYRGQTIETSEPLDPA